MKVIWEAEDITPGRRYSKPGVREQGIIGYLSYMDGAARYVSISDQDGMVTEPLTKVGLAQVLTENGYLPMEIL